MGRAKSLVHRENISRARKLMFREHPEKLEQLRENGLKVTSILVANNKRRALPVGVASRNSLLKSYQLDAATRNLTWTLTGEEFDVLVKGICSYCGIAPQQIHRAGIQINGVFCYNGIDRRDSSQGYVKENCVSCCKRCNWWKSDMTAQDFLAHVRKIASHNHQHALAVGGTK